MTCNSHQSTIPDAAIYAVCLPIIAAGVAWWIYLFVKYGRNR